MEALRRAERFAGQRMGDHDVIADFEGVHRLSSAMSRSAVADDDAERIRGEEAREPLRRVVERDLVREELVEDGVVEQGEGNGEAPRVAPAGDAAGRQPSDL